MDKLFKYLFLISLGIGIILFSITGTKVIGIIILFIFQPYFLLYYITFFHKKISEENIQLRFRVPFIVGLILTIIITAFHTKFKLLHWPGATLLLILNYTAGLLTLILGLIYLIMNKRNFRNRLMYEFIILMIPVLTIFMNSWIINAVPKEEYAKSINEQYLVLNNIAYDLKVKNTDNSASVDSLLFLIKHKKTELIRQSGGVLEDNTIVGGLNTTIPTLYDQRPENFKIIYTSIYFDDNLKDKLKNAKTVYDLLIVLTEMEIDLRIRSK